jgi:ankyrin repeat protein
LSVTLAKLAFTALAAAAPLGTAARAQIPPTPTEIGAYRGLHSAAARGQAGEIMRLIRAGADVNGRDANGRTPLHVATYRGDPTVVRALLAGKADPGLLDRQRYDAVTIAAVRNDVATLRTLLEHGASARLTTSPYDGTALIAAAHLGHDGVVRELIRAGAPLDHVNNLGWTALIEAVILGNGGPRHTETVRALVEAGTDVNLADRNGVTPLAHARQRGYAEMAAILEKAGGR